MNIYTIEPLSEEEVKELEDLYNYHSKRRVRKRAHMVLLSNKGYLLSEIADIVGVHRDTVSKHIHNYEEVGVDALYDKEIPGRPPILNKEEQKQVGEWLDRSPRELGYQYSNWTMKLLKYHVWKTFGKSISEERVRVLAHKLGFNLVRPTQLPGEANEEDKLKARRVLSTLESLAGMGLIRLFYQDEAKVKRLPTKTFVWTRKGEQKVIPTKNDHKRFAVFGAFNPIDGQPHYRLHPEIEKEGFELFIDQLKRNYDQKVRPLVIVLDNAPAHGYRGQHGLIKAEEGVYFYFLPPYCPDLNLAERIWKDLRKRVTHNYLFETMEALKEAARRYMKYLQTMKSRVVSVMGVV